MSGHPQANGLTPRPTRTTGPRRSSSARSCEGFVQAVNKFEFRTYVSALEGLEEDGVGELLGAPAIINTRTFYYVTAQMEAYPPDDRLALLPVADLFNHAAGGCQVSFTPDGCFSVCADRVYRAGEEVYVSYGEHSNIRTIFS